MWRWSHGPWHHARVSLHGHVRRALIALPFAVLVVSAGLGYQLLVGRYRPRPVCWADMDRRHLRYGRFADLLEVACVSSLEDLRRDHPEVYACASKCVVGAESEVDLEKCPARCPGFVDPLGPKVEKAP